MNESEFDQIVNALLGGDTPRVWSLLVTMFGDLALSPDARLSGACVNALTAAIGIKPEATRVALHRLRKEGWIESHRTGRQSRYGLTPQGRHETERAWPRVYGPEPAEAKVCLVLEGPAGVAGQEQPQDGSDRVQLAPRTWLSSHATETLGLWSAPLSASAEVPHWVSSKLCPPDVQTASQVFHARLTTVEAHDDLATLTVLQRTALRVVIVHEWRRLVLRVPRFPERLFSAGWKGQACRAAVHRTLETLAAPDLDVLEAHIEST